MRICRWSTAARPLDRPKRVSVCAARTLNPIGQARVTPSPRYEQLRAVRGPRQEEKGPEIRPKRFTQELKAIGSELLDCHRFSKAATSIARPAWGCVHLLTLLCRTTCQSCLPVATKHDRRSSSHEAPELGDLVQQSVCHCRATHQCEGSGASPRAASYDRATTR